ncbi:Multi-component transcriptional regulator, winged helix family [Planktothrix serta PCC 8927]|uniref:Multi-component transcriptional regulator, winged helix family n=1 Tax=Planktothrix serta PCC 8927 TaxID=671068 RepID=A0A7Z9BU03_9CYAN|nr:response regulator [Planktothrix serta]VXD22699.1 Multi-component transcriptional regulator, winged helix family [Planktothrix serta PCC 8927]
MKILLVEDDTLTSAALAEILNAHQYTVNTVADGITTLEMAETFIYDLILLDIEIPKLDGISVCKQLRIKGYQNPILLLTARDSSTDRVMGLDAGADDYVVKPFDTDELMARIRALLRRGKSVSGAVMTWENLCFDPINNEIKSGDRLVHLTSKEYCLLELFLLNPKRIFSRRAILDRLWDFAESPGEETVSTHIKCLRQKIKAAGSSDPIETVHGLGYRLREPSNLPESQPVDQSQNSRKEMTAITSRIWENFKDKVRVQISILEQVSPALLNGKLSAKLQQEAKKEAHKLAGSLGVFGLREGSQVAREIEDLLENPNLDISQAQLISDLVVALSLEASRETLLTPFSSEPVAYSPLILIVDDDLMLAERIRVEAIAWGLRIEIATDLSVARKMIAQNPPNIILLDLTFPNAQEDGLTLLEELTDRIPQIPVITLTGRQSLTDRVTVARLGVKAFLQKPLPAYEILKTVTEVLSQSRPGKGNRVLIVDDDPSLLAYVARVLEATGLTVTTLENPEHFWEVLLDCRPDLLILDWEMSGFNGIDLCQAVRTDQRWRNLPIIFFSVHTEENTIIQAFAVGASDYLSKTIATETLIVQVLRRLQPIPR